MKETEYSLLKEFLYEAIFQPDETSSAPKSIIEKPELKVYIENFGQKKMIIVYVPKRTKKLLVPYG